jgi:hypothetical protein
MSCKRRHRSRFGVNSLGCGVEHVQCIERFETHVMHPTIVLGLERTVAAKHFFMCLDTFDCGVTLPTHELGLDG